MNKYIFEGFLVKELKVDKIALSINEIECFF